METIHNSNFRKKVLTKEEINKLIEILIKLSKEFQNYNEKSCYVNEGK